MSTEGYLYSPGSSVKFCNIAGRKNNNHSKTSTMNTRILRSLLISGPEVSQGYKIEHDTLCSYHLDLACSCVSIIDQFFRCITCSNCKIITKYVKKNKRFHCLTIIIAFLIFLFYFGGGVDKQLELTTLYI